MYAARNSSGIGARSAMEDLSRIKDARRICMCMVLAALGHLSSHHQRDDEGQDDCLLRCEEALRRRDTRRESTRKSSRPGRSSYLRVFILVVICLVVCEIVGGDLFNGRGYDSDGTAYPYRYPLLGL